MASADDYARWIVDNESRRGTPEFETVAAAYKAARNAAAAPNYDPTEGMSTTELTLAGIGRGMTAGARAALQGISQLVGADSVGAGLVKQSTLDEARRLDAPLMNTTAGKFGNVVGLGALAAPAALIPGANTALGASTIGAGLGALTTEGGLSDRALGAAFGAAGGLVGKYLGDGLGAGARWLRGAVGGRPQQLPPPGALGQLPPGTTPAQIAPSMAAPGQTTMQQAASSLPQNIGLNSSQQQALAAGRALGFELTPGKAANNPTLQRIEAALQSNPMTARPFDAMKQRNSERLGQIAAQAVGENADNLGAQVISQAEARMGAVFNKVADGTPVRLDPIGTGARLKAIEDASEGLIGGNGSLADNALFKRLDGFINESGGATREQLRTLSSKLGKAAKNNMTTANGDRELGAALFEMKHLVDEQVLGTLQGAAKDEFSTAMKQYGTLMQLTARNNVVNPSSGTVNPRALAALLQQKDRGGFLMGRNQSDLYNAARFAQAFPDIVGDSGTATRMMGAADWLTSLPASTVSSLYLSPAGSAAARGAMGAAGAAGRGAGALARGPAALMGNPVVQAGMPGLLGVMTPEMLLDPRKKKRGLLDTVTNE